MADSYVSDGGVVREVKPVGGPVLVGTPRFLDPDMFVELDWIQSAYPWMSLAVRSPMEAAPGTLGSVLTRSARRGAIVLAAGASGGDAVDAIRNVLPSDTDFMRWLRYAAPRWSRSAQARAVYQLQDGLDYHAPPRSARTEPGRPVARTKLWIQIGRALYGARAVQGDARVPLERLSTGYHDSRSLRRALRRAFGLSIDEIRGTVGWRWLLWRFLCGAGTGKVKAWDRKL